MEIGYARVSGIDPNLDRQIAVLRTEGCSKIYREKVSGKDKKNRPSSPKPSTGYRPTAFWCLRNGTAPPAVSSTVSTSWRRSQPAQVPAMPTRVQPAVASSKSLARLIFKVRPCFD